MGFFYLTASWQPLFSWFLLSTPTSSNLYMENHRLVAAMASCSGSPSAAVRLAEPLDSVLQSAAPHQRDSCSCSLASPEFFLELNSVIGHHVAMGIVSCGCAFLVSCLVRAPSLPGILKQAFEDWIRRQMMHKAYTKLLIILHGHGDTPHCHPCQRETPNQKDPLKTGTVLSRQRRQRMATFKPRLAGLFEKTPAPGRAHSQPSSTSNPNRTLAYIPLRLVVAKRPDFENRNVWGHKNIFSLPLRMLEAWSGVDLGFHIAHFELCINFSYTLIFQKKKNQTCYDS